VSKPGTTPTPGVYEAEDATLTGSAAVRQLSLASGGEAVGTIGGAPGNDSILEFSKVRVDADGSYALTIRYSNEEQSPATHYNPDPLARLATLDVNGTTSTVTFPHSFHQNNFWELTVEVQLEKGDNVISFSSEEKPNFDGTTYISDRFPGVLLRSQYAPNIDNISVAPFVEVAGTTPGEPGQPGGSGTNPQGTDNAAGAPGSGKLAATGADWSFVALLGLLMVAAGAVVLSKRRRNQHS
jgi:LPXTG-motif cell wall-anchored protein